MQDQGKRCVSGSIPARNVRILRRRAKAVGGVRAALMWTFLAGATVIACQNDEPTPPSAGPDAAGGDGGTNAVPSPCGNGNIDPGESCDDGNTARGDGCSDTCKPEPNCDALRACCFGVICPRVGCNTVPVNVCDDGTLYAIQRGGDANCAAVLAQLDEPECLPEDGGTGSGGADSGSGGTGSGASPADGGEETGGTPGTGGASGTGGREEPPSCAAGESRCDDDCVNTKRDRKNCGECGNACGQDQVCEAGACTCGGGALTKCASDCVDLDSSTSNCGACGAACGADQTCISGACRCLGTMSPDDGIEPEAGVTCHQPTRDHCPTFYEDNTNTVDVQSCLDDEVCFAYADVDGTVTGECGTEEFCDGPRVLCPGGGCVVPTGDPANCGACGNVCAPGERCENGVCAPVGDDCGGDEPTNIASDWRNCGSCGFECENPGCAEGECTCLAVCDEGCTDPWYDVNNCGACGVRCNFPAEYCMAGVCTGLSGTTACTRRVNDAVCSADFTMYGFQYVCPGTAMPPSNAFCDYVGAEAGSRVWCCDR